MNNTTIASISVADQAYRAECKMPARIAQSRDTSITILGDRVSFTWNGEPYDLPISTCGISYAKPVAEARVEAAKELYSKPEAKGSLAAKVKGRPGRKPGFKPAPKKQTTQTGEHIAASAVSGKRPTNGALTAN